MIIFWLIFRKDNYFYVLEKKPRDLGFLFSGEKSWFFVLAHFQKNLGFICPAIGTKICAFFFPDRPVVGTKPAATTYGIYCEMRLSSRSMPYATVQLAVSVFFRGRHFSLFSVLFATCGLQYIL